MPKRTKKERRERQERYRRKHMAALTFGVMTFEINGEKRSLDIGKITAPEWKILKRYTGFSTMDFMQNVDEIEVIEGLYWLALRRGGIDVEISTVEDIEGFEPLAFLATVDMATDKSKSHEEEDAAPLAETPGATPSTPPRTKASKSSKAGSVT
jgi:hypothetical protein